MLSFFAILSNIILPPSEGLGLNQFINKNTLEVLVFLMFVKEVLCLIWEFSKNNNENDVKITLPVNMYLIFGMTYITLWLLLVVLPCHEELFYKRFFLIVIILDTCGHIFFEEISKRLEP